MFFIIESGMTSSAWFIVAAATGDGVRVQFNAVELFNSLTKSRFSYHSTSTCEWMRLSHFRILTRTPYHTPHVLFNTPVFHFQFYFHSNRHDTHTQSSFPLFLFFLCLSFAHLLCHSLVCIHNFSIIGSSHTKISSKPYRVIQSCNQMLCSYLHGYVKLNLT